jgi:hypothetical protein
LMLYIPIRFVHPSSVPATAGPSGCTSPIPDPLATNGKKDNNPSDISLQLDKSKT